MTRSEQPSCDRVVAAVAELAGITSEVLRGPTQVRLVGRARTAAAYLLRTDCGMTRAATAEHVGRSDQTVSDLTSKACASLANEGPVAGLIRHARRLLEIDVQEPEPDLASVIGEVQIGKSIALPKPRPIPTLRDWRIAARLTQKELASNANIARESLIRLENGRPATGGVWQRLADALHVTPGALLEAPSIGEINVLRPTAFALRGVASWRELGRLTQARLAARVGIARETLVRIENGRPARRDVAERIAERLVLAPSVMIGTIELDDPDRKAYRQCTDCGGPRPVRGFVAIKDTAGVYLCCRICRARRARERYQSNPQERERQKARVRSSRRVRSVERLKIGS